MTQPTERYPAGGCVLRDKTKCKLPPATCCNEGLAIRWPGTHEPVEGYDFMPPEWCGGCEHCISYPVPTVCVACSYSPEGGPLDPVVWPCAPHRARLAAESTEVLMATPPQNTALIDGLRAFYEQAGRLAAAEMPNIDWPAFEDLTGEQNRAWMLAHAATIEVSVRMADAFLALELDA